MTKNQFRKLVELTGLTVKEVAVECGYRAGHFYHFYQGVHPVTQKASWALSMRFKKEFKQAIKEA